MWWRRLQDCSRQKNQIKEPEKVVHCSDKFLTFFHLGKNCAREWLSTDLFIFWANSVGIVEQKIGDKLRFAVQIRSDAKLVDQLNWVVHRDGRNEDCCGSAYISGRYDMDGSNDVRAAKGNMKQEGEAPLKQFSPWCTQLQAGFCSASLPVVGMSAQLGPKLYKFSKNSDTVLSYHCRSCSGSLRVKNPKMV